MLTEPLSSNFSIKTLVKGKRKGGKKHKSLMKELIIPVDSHSVKCNPIKSGATKC